MRPPRLLALLIVLAALLAIGAWWFVRKEHAAEASGLADTSAIAAQKSAEAALETNALAERKEEPAADAGPGGKPPALPLADSTRIHGRVARGALGLPVAGIEVCCTKNVTFTRSEGRLVIGDNGPRVFGAQGKFPEAPSSTCTSGSDGCFEFKDLERGALYTLTARGAGWILVEPLAAIAPSEEPRTLAVQRIYSARVLAIDTQGKPPAGECQYLRYARVAGPGECPSVPLPEGRAAPDREPWIPPGVEIGEQPATRNYSFASDCDAVRLGPFRVLICCPGFERQDFEFWAYPEEQHADTTLLRLQRAAAPAGLLRVQQDCGCEASFCEHLLEGRVELEPADGAGKPLVFELTGLVREQSFQDIPSGSWHVRARARCGGFCFPAQDAAPLELQIGEAPASFHIPVGKLGAIRWKLRGPGDQLASEGLSLLWRGERGAESSAQLWMSVVMRGLEAGPQSFEIDGARCANVEGARSAPSGTRARLEVDVRAGETQTVVVRTP